MMQYSQALVRKLEKRNDELSLRTAELAVSEARIRSIFDTEPDGVVVFGRDGVITEINRAGLEIFDAAALGEMAERQITRLVAMDHGEAFQDAMTASWSGHRSSVEFQVAPAHGAPRWLEMHAAPLRDAQGTITALLGILRDHTARKELEAQFVQAQKMEVVGHLAGGIAHDFNNMLGIILGYAEIAMADLSSGTPLHRHLETIGHTAKRAAALTRQLLIFSRQQAMEAEVLDLSELLVGIDPMLRRLIGENITLETVPEPELRPVEADPGQIEQVLMNLTVNARDAMPNGGKLTLTAGNATVSADRLPHPEMAPGDYVVLSVSDEGTGMSEAVKAKIFDAFFTTKAAGKGTGLGLATCHTIVKQWHGYITVESELGHGTTFSVYLPPASHSLQPVATAAEAGAPPRGDEVILLVEDEPGLRDLAATILSRQGYTVLKAGNGQEALRVVREPHPRPIDLVVTDMVMPEMGGRMMAEWLQATHPEIKVLFTSGYTDCGIDGALEEGIAFLAKPYTPSSLARKVREVIDGQARTNVGSAELVNLFP
jgi:PAS domain S-box-containing protein